MLLFLMSGNINAKKTLTTIYEREFEVWFTTEIPIINLAWKLSGLPGLIVEARSKNRFHNFYFTSITKLSIPDYIYKKYLLGQLVMRKLLQLKELKMLKLFLNIENQSIPIIK